MEYHFVREDEFERLSQRGELLEWARFAGNLYGTPRAPVLAQLAAGNPALLEIDLQGARQVRAAMPEARFVFLAPPSFEELARRLSGRGTEAEATIATRLERARVEMAAAGEFDDVLVNDDVPLAAAALVRLATAAG